MLLSSLPWRELPKSQFQVNECHFGISPVNYSDSDLTDKNQFGITKVQTVDPQRDNRARHV